MKRVREFIESILFAGMKPGGAPAAKPQSSRLRSYFERFLSGGPAPADPLYLSNRTLGQKLKAWSLIAIPCAVLAVGIVVTLSNVFAPAAVAPPNEPTPDEATAKLLPNISPDIKLAAASEVQVLELKVEGSKVTGIVKNSTAREIASVELIIDLTNETGSQVGAVNCTVEKLPASGSKNFQFTVKQSNAAFAMIREVIAR